MSARSGAVSLAELVLVLVLFGCVMGGLGGFIRAQARLAARQATDLRLMEAARAARIILGSELRPLTQADIAARSADSIRVRAFRGGGVVCWADGPRIGIRYRGVRWPDPEKDSVLVLFEDGGEASHALLEAGGDACGGNGMRLSLDSPPAEGAALALVYETGAYHLADAALRYRRGAGGRQPLVEALMQPAAFGTGAGAAVVFELAARRDSLPLARRRYRVSAPFLNPASP